MVSDKSTKAMRASRFVISRIMDNAAYADLSALNKDWFASDVHRAVYEYALSVPKGGFNVGQMYNYIDDAEINAVLDINLGFASKAKEEEYYVDCVLTLANEYLSARLAELKAAYNSLSDAEEKKATVNEIAALQKKLKSKSVGEKL